MKPTKASLVIHWTCKFSVIGLSSERHKSGKEEKDDNQVKDCRNHEFCESNTKLRRDAGYPNTLGLPVIKVRDFLLHRKNNATDMIRDKLWDALEKFGFVILSASKSSEIGGIVNDLTRVIDNAFFPSNQSHEQNYDEPNNQTRNAGDLESGFVYVSEKEVPMWNLGYELCDDIREVYRVHAGSPDSQPWPKHCPKARHEWLRAMALCRHICDEALSLTLDYDLKQRPGSGIRSWKNNSLGRQSTTNAALPYHLKPEYTLPDRLGDKSIMYAMNYFNDAASIQARESGCVTGTNEVIINVKKHTDPSLFVLEPFLSQIEGLQIKPRPSETFYRNISNVGGSDGWISCDGNDSPIHNEVRQDENGGSSDSIAMVLFVGRAFAERSLSLCGRSVIPTLHRVVGPSIPSDKPRKVVIYEQKYEEYFA